MKIIRVQATGDGRIVDWAALKQGRLVDASRLAKLFLTTILTDVIADLCALAETLDGSRRLEMISPNGFTTATFELRIVGQGFDLLCTRRLVRGWFPLNPFAAERGKNYDVTVALSAASAEVAERFTSLLQRKYPCTVLG